MHTSPPPATLDTVYREHAERIRRHCRRMLRDHDEAEDVVQDVFLRMITRGSSFRGDAQWSTWLFRVATNLCLNRQRDRGRRKLLLARNVRPQPVTPSAAERIASRRTLASLFAALDAPTRRITVDYYLLAVDQAEIGRRLGLARVTINRRLGGVKRAARRLHREAAPGAMAA